MDTQEIKNIVERAGKIPSWTSEAERIELASLAGEVEDGGLIVEIGGLYGGMTAVIGLSASQARIVVVDDFSWSPIKGMKASAGLLLENCNAAGVTNVRIVTGDSREVGRDWNEAIDLLWIDGGHSYEFVKSDLDKFGPYAKRIALHDWDNPEWATIRKAVEDFIKDNPAWSVSHNVEMVVVLKKE